MMELIESKRFKKEVAKIKDSKTRQRLFKQIGKILQNPAIGEFLFYKGGSRKIYVPPYRLLYSFKDNKIYLLRFEHRDKVYRKSS
tara:strand:+ start:1622 stop:1876 length:255 start_codon:yes stop_codon:yes gene_type:complete